MTRNIHWITSLLGTAPAIWVGQDAELNIIDVRTLVDKPGNLSKNVREKIIEGCEALRDGKKTVVCCDYGISRSNAVAAGILAMTESISFENATRRVIEATGQQDIKPSVLKIVRDAMNIGEEAVQALSTGILVTGGTGFIGSRLLKSFADRDSVFGLNRDQLDLLSGSTHLDLCAEELRINTIIHLANPRTYTSNKALGETLTMLRNVLDVCVSRELKLIYLSGWEVYSGYRSSCLIADESLPLLPRGPYGETKFLCEKLIEHTRITQGLRCVLLRSSAVYGAGGDRPKFMFNFIDKIKRGEIITTHLYRNSRPSLDLLYVDDLVDAVKKAIQSNYYGNLNIGTGILTTTWNIAQMLNAILKRNNEVMETEIDVDVACIAMDWQKAREVLGWRPITKLTVGLERILAGLDIAGGK